MSCSTENRQRSGRGRLTTEREDRLLRIMQRREPAAASRQMTQSFNAQTRLNISARTTRRRMVSFGLHSRVAARKPLISAANKRKRVQWAHQHRDWTIADWHNVIFTDEVPFSMIQTKARRYVRCLPAERHAPGMTRPMIHSGGGKFMYWGAFRGRQRGPLIEIGKRLNGRGYLQLLQNHLDVETMRQNDEILQQDNAPIHKAACVTNWLHEQGIEVMQWPPQSPDMNPIEHAWSYMKRELDKVIITSGAMMRTEIQRVWAAIDPAFLETLVTSMPRRIANLLQNRGGATNY